jgi:hypothetical protein
VEGLAGDQADQGRAHRAEHRDAVVVDGGVTRQADAHGAGLAVGQVVELDPRADAHERPRRFAGLDDHGAGHLAGQHAAARRAAGGGVGQVGKNLEVGLGHIDRGQGLGGLGLGGKHSLIGFLDGFEPWPAL